MKKLKTILILLLALAVIFVMAGCDLFGEDSGSTDDNTPTTPETPSEPEEPENPSEPEKPAKPTTYKIGEMWTVENNWSLVIDSVIETTYRNEFSDKEPKAVYIVNYRYKNLGYSDDIIFNGLYLSFDKVIDMTGQLGYSYSGNIDYAPQDTPIGATCNAQDCFGVDNAGNFKLTISKYDNNNNKQTATFVLDGEFLSDTDTYEPGKAIGTGTTILPNNPTYKIGETWIVNGQWELTIDSIEETTDRNEFENVRPNAVYIINYTYKNLGYENEIMEGLYFSIDDMVVDSTGLMGYTYAGDITYYPQSTPIGASCKAQDCFGVDNAGNLTLIIHKTDGNNIERVATFVLEV